MKNYGSAKVSSCVMSLHTSRMVKVGSREFEVVGIEDGKGFQGYGLHPDEVLSNRLFWSGGKSPTSPVVLWKNEKDICNMRTPEFAAKARKQGCFIHFN